MTGPVENELYENDEEEHVPRDKGSYRLVRLADEESAVASSALQAVKREHLLLRNLFPDQAFSIRGIRILDGEEAVRFLKFVVITFIGLLLIHWFVALMDWERDELYTISDMILYDGNYIILDIMVFYVVGRLFRQRGVDHAGWVLICWLAAFYTSWTTTFAFLRYSVSLYEMHCKWPYALWVFCSVLIPLVVVVICKHVQHAVDRRVLVMKFVEISLTIAFCLAAVASDPNFHFHHWYAGWLIGMHANFDTWWSRATMAWCWGLYIEGVGVYGRDPTLTCAYSYFLSTEGFCPYMSCYMHPTQDNSTHVYEAMEVPDWRNCSGYIP